MAVVTMRQLLESGVHFGHQTRRWNPKMKRFIFTERNGIYIIDLQQSLSYIDRAYEFVKETVAHGGTILFVGTKKQAQEAIAEQAHGSACRTSTSAGWAACSPTSHRAQAAAAAEGARGDRLRRRGRLRATPRRNCCCKRREKDKLDRTLGGIRDMNKVPSAPSGSLTPRRSTSRSDEAKKLGIPV
jgi:small subunit ribosomal protein S2